MPIQTWWTFFITSFLISGTPGPTMLHVMSSSIRHGFHRSFITMAGCVSAVFIVIATSIMGLGAMLGASPAMFNILRYAGAAYLIYIGIKSLRAKAQSSIDSNSPPDEPSSASDKIIFMHALLVGLSNPKLFLFAVAFFPQFINPALPEWPQLLILFFTFLIVECCWYMVYALGGNGIVRYLRNEKTQLLFNRITGILFIGFGIFLILFKEG